MKRQICRQCECKLRSNQKQFCSKTCKEEWRYDHLGAKEDSLEERLKVGFLMLDFDSADGEQ